MPSDLTVARARLDYRVRRLTAADIDRIVVLYASVFERTPIGFLARRTKADFERIFGKENFAGGVFADEQLVGYQIYNTERELRFDERRYRKAADIIGSAKVLFGKGTVIGLAHQSEGLAKRVSAFTSDLGRAAGYRYRIGHAFVTNINSIKYQLATGRTIVGLSTDEFGTNFITCGYLGRTTIDRETGVCPADDLDRIASMLEEARIVALKQDAGGWSFVFGEVTET
jgi:hypothetical protein